MPDVDWNKEKIQALVAAAGHAINRSRYVFVVLNISAIISVTAIFNAYLPWLRNVINRPNPGPKENIDHLRKVLFEDLSVINIPFLGTKIHVDDLSVFISPALFIVIVWQFYCIIRENNIIHTIKKEASKYLSDKERISYMYHGVAHYFLFTNAFVLDPNTKQKGLKGGSIVIKVLMYVPFWIPLVLLICDVLSYYIAHKTQADIKAPSSNGIETETFEVYIRAAFTGMFSLASLFFCHKCTEYDDYTRQYVNEIKDMI